MPPIKLPHFFFQIAQASGGAAKAVIGADNGNVVPHQAADFVPIVIDDHEFIWGCRVAVLPLGDFHHVARLTIRVQMSEHFIECAARRDISFEQGI